MKLTVGTSHGIYSGDERLDRMDLKLVLACRAVKIIIETSGGLLAGTRAGVYRADLAGLHWSLSGLEEYGIRQIKKTAVNDLIAGTTPAAVFKSSDEGLNWQELKAFSEFPEAQNWCLPSDPPRPAQACAIVTHASDPNRLWVGVEVGALCTVLMAVHSGLWAFQAEYLTYIQWLLSPMIQTYCLSLPAMGASMVSPQWWKATREYFAQRMQAPIGLISGRT